eukprot:scaffold7630_cov376-Prasinococcus_capsulatus_cf.AAC.3
MAHILWVSPRIFNNIQTRPQAPPKEAQIPAGSPTPNLESAPPALALPAQAPRRGERASAVLSSSSSGACNARWPRRVGRGRRRPRRGAAATLRLAGAPLLPR